MSKTQISASGGTGMTSNVGTLYNERGVCMIIWKYGGEKLKLKRKPRIAVFKGQGGTLCFL